jgi:zona occludens toxin
MITLITGTPGAGKTLYAISKLLRSLVGSSVKAADGSSVPVQLFTNINGLLIDHVLIDGGSDGGLSGWHKWVKPGAVICFDEVQREWSPRPNGSKVPDYISALETHRHMGVDFIILTQHPMLLDQNVRALVGRHIHLRRLGGSPLAIAYEWDHCSRSLLFSKSLAKAPFKYDKSVFKLYKSAELHTKPKTSIPSLVYVVGAAVFAAAFAIPMAMDRISSKSVAAPSVGSPSVSSFSGGVGDRSGVRGARGGGYDAAAFVPVIASVPLSAPAYDALRVVVSMPTVVGGVCKSQDPASCVCYTHQGTAALTGAACREIVDATPFDPYRSLVTAPLPVPGAVRTQPAPVVPAASPFASVVPSLASSGS